jgi:hypothetical protein
VTAANPLAAVRFAVLGVTDNGRRPAELTEVAVIHIDQAAVLRGPLVWRAQPNAMPTRGAVAAFGLRRADLLTAPPWVEVAEHLAEALAGRVPVSCDLSAGYRLLSAYLPDWHPPVMLDLAWLARTARPEAPAHDDLRTLAELAGTVPPDTAPPCGAARQAHACARVLLALLRADASRNLPARLAAGEFNTAP